MSKKIEALTMPKWGIEMEEGKLTEWLIEEGSSFSKGDALLVVETDKISNEIEAAQATGTRVDEETLASVEALTQMAHGMLDLGVRKAVIIHCVERVVWMDANRNTFVIEIEPLRPEEIASNLGAGDAFCAGLLYGIHESRGPERAIQLGKAAAQASLKGLTATSAISAAAIKSLR